MCLRVKGKPVVRYNKRERVFYKVLQVSDIYHISDDPSVRSWTVGLCSPYFGAKVELGVENVIPDSAFTCTEDITYKPAYEAFKYDVDGTRMTRTSTGIYSVGYGCFHLFKKKEDAELEAFRLNEDAKFWGRIHRFKVYKAIVPVGTAYVNGKYCEADCVGVKKVRYEEI